ncbi:MULTISPECIES: hypothetical protein [Burkholderia cepacia complex]|uniref:hypothetical protein n=1 Tax=Burkholderia cepacia complex TaxID=87882 RepID=UPI000758C20D|nr:MULTISPECIES: hypothetical protein [Burkholderia cepacia complex]
MNDSRRELCTLWQYVDPLSIKDAAALIVGVEPRQVGSDGLVRHHDDLSTMWEDTQSVEVALKLLTSAILDGQLKATIRRQAWMRGWDEYPLSGSRYTARVRAHQGNLFDTPEEEEDFRKVQQAGVIYHVEPDWNMSTVRRADLIAFLRHRGVPAPFFYSQRRDSAPSDYRDPGHPRYAPKLAASIDAWEACADTTGRSPKQALEQHLREQAPRFGLVDKQGHVSQQAIEECARVANWSVRGGAPYLPRETSIPS